MPGCLGTGVAERSYPTPEVRGGGREELPHVQGAAAALCWSSREEIPHHQGKINPSKMVGVAEGIRGKHTETIIMEK